MWLQALQDNAGDACIELFAAAIPHFPPKKTPLGLPDEASLTTATPSSHSLCERYGPYSTRDSTPESGAGHHGNCPTMFLISVVILLHRMGLYSAYSSST